MKNTKKKPSPSRALEQRQKFEAVQRPVPTERWTRRPGWKEIERPPCENPRPFWWTWWERATCAFVPFLTLHTPNPSMDPTRRWSIFCCCTSVSPCRARFSPSPYGVTTHICVHIYDYTHMKSIYDYTHMKSIYDYTHMKSTYDYTHMSAHIWVHIYECTYMITHIWYIVNYELIQKSGRRRLLPVVMTLRSEHAQTCNQRHPSGPGPTPVFMALRCSKAQRYARTPPV